MPRCLICLVPFLIGTAAVPDAAAQVLASAEVSIGIGAGTGGSYHHRKAPEFDLMLGTLLADTPTRAIVGGLTIGLPLPVARTLECLLLPDGECAPNFPQFFSGGPVLGVQWGSPGSASARVVTGPAYYHSYEGRGALGLQGRLDLASPPLLHTAVLASVRRAVLPSFGGETLGITSFALGLRIQ